MNYHHSKTLKNLYLAQARIGLEYTQMSSSQFANAELIERKLSEYERVSLIIERLELNAHKESKRRLEVNLALKDRPVFLDMVVGE